MGEQYRHLVSETLAAPWTAEFPEPASVEEARYRRTELGQAIQEVLNHLAVPKEVDPQGNRVFRDGRGDVVTAREWHQWRNRAQTALRVLTARHKALKARVHEFLEAEKAAGTCQESFIGLRDPADPHVLLGACKGVLTQLLRRGVGLQPNEYAVLAEVQRYFDAHGALEKAAKRAKAVVPDQTEAA